MRVVTAPRSSPRRSTPSAPSGAASGLVPTMGALHAGHRSLIERAAAECDVVAVTVFVNPLQFNDAADLAAYPRDLDADVALARSAGASIVFAPPVEEMYGAAPGRRRVDGARRRRERRASKGRRARDTSTGCRRWWPSSSPCRAGAAPISGRRTSSSWPWSAGWWRICRSR